MLIGKMDKDYTTYSADQLLNDDFFIQSELHPTEKSRAFWSDLQIKSAALSQEIENARLFLHTIKTEIVHPWLPRMNMRYGNASN